MKRTILLLMLMSTALLQAQQVSRAALAQQVDEYVQRVNVAAATFLDRGRPVGERLKAIEPYATIYDEKQVAQFKRTVANADEPAEIRAAALDRILQYVIDDPRLSALVLEWLGDPRTPPPLRLAALRADAAISFSTMAMPEVYQKLLDDPELEFRIYGYTKLIAHGDARAQQKLIAGLENPGAAPMPAPEAIGILSLALKKEYYPAVFKLLRETKDDATRLEAIRALAAYPEARQTLVAISRNDAEADPIREAALGALYAGDRDHIVGYVTPILASPKASPRLKSIGIQMTIDVRQSMSYRFKAKRADAYDKLVGRLARESQDTAVRQVAQKYVDVVRPKY